MGGDFEKADMDPKYEHSTLRPTGYRHVTAPHGMAHEKMPEGKVVPEVPKIEQPVQTGGKLTPRLPSKF